MHTLYLGPSWAVQSFESTYGLDDPVKTNLATELGLSNFSNLSLYAKSNYDQLADAELFMQQHPELAPFRIIMVTANSLQDAHKRKNISQIDFAKKFLTSDDPLSIVRSLEHEFYQRLVDIGVPVALIGAHTDVTCESHNNITVIHPSWQNFLAQQCGLNSFYGWPADLGHRWLRGIVIPDRGPPEHFELETKPSNAVVREIHQVLRICWKLLEQNKLFTDCHPNIMGNRLFAKEIKPLVDVWLDNHA